MKNLQMGILQMKNLKKNNFCNYKMWIFIVFCIILILIFVVFLIICYQDKKVPFVYLNPIHIKEYFNFNLEDTSHTRLYRPWNNNKLKTLSNSGNFLSEYLGVIYVDNQLNIKVNCSEMFYVIDVYSYPDFSLVESYYKKQDIITNLKKGHYFILLRVISSNEDFKLTDSYVTISYKKSNKSNEYEICEEVKDSRFIYAKSENLKLSSKYIVKNVIEIHTDEPIDIDFYYFKRQNSITSLKLYLDDVMTYPTYESEIDNYKVNTYFRMEEIVYGIFDGKNFKIEIKKNLE